jgi:hypothetical protein
MTDADRLLLEVCCRAACEANKLDPDEEISHPYNRAYGVQVKPRWQWLADPTVCPEITAVIDTVCTWYDNTQYTQELRKQRNRLADKADPLKCPGPKIGEDIRGKLI